MDESNHRQREEFIDFWVTYMKTHSDKEWSRQQNVLTNSVLKSCTQLSREEYAELKRASIQHP
ncbi:hypothetical protein HYU22_03580 [Candidatus Woesearchaeota archaeon]|nr:hypothetical protein [Candidatus Woesearchaeota archaeon]